MNVMNKFLQTGQTLKLLKAKRGEYTLGYELYNADAADALTLTVEKGRISAFINNQWQPVTGRLNLQSLSQSNPLQLRVDRQAAFSFGLTDGSSISPNLGAGISLDPNLPTDLGDKRSSAWAIGKVDKLTGIEWDEGIVSSSSTPGIRISKTIGGEDVSDYAKFSLTRVATVQIQTEGAITQLLNSKGMVVVDSSDGYQSLLSAQLKRGTYYLTLPQKSGQVT